MSLNVNHLSSTSSESSAWNSAGHSSGSARHSNANRALGVYAGSRQAWSTVADSAVFATALNLRLFLIDTFIKSYTRSSLRVMRAGSFLESPSIPATNSKARFRLMLSRSHSSLLTGEGWNWTTDVHRSSTSTCLGCGLTDLMIGSLLIICIPFTFGKSRLLKTWNDMTIVSFNLHKWLSLLAMLHVVSSAAVISCVTTLYGCGGDYASHYLFCCMWLLAPWRLLLSLKGIQMIFFNLLTGSFILRGRLWPRNFYRVIVDEGSHSFELVI